MLRWNGYGEENITYPLSDSAKAYFRQTLGDTKPPQDVRRESLTIPPPHSFSNPHPLIQCDDETRLRYALGQSFPDLPTDLPVEPNLAMDWLARYGESSLDFLAPSKADEYAPLQSGDNASLADLRWVMCHESVRHLDDLLLPRTRLGLTRPEGGAALLPRIRPVAQQELNWTDSQWEKESARYLAYWGKTYRVPHLT